MKSFAMKSFTLGILVSGAVAYSAFAGDVDASKDYKTPVPPAPACFKNQELQLDIFGSYINMTHSDDGIFHHHNHITDNRGRDGGGGGVGVNYFFCRYAGIGVDGDIDSTRHGLWDVTGKLILRYPIEMGQFCLAPYIFGGGGLQTDGITTGAYVAGGGLEFRVTPHVGVYTEGRYTWAADTRENDNTNVRLGLRFAF